MSVNKYISSAGGLSVKDGFGGRLREERERLGLTQEELAATAGVRRLAQGQYEREVSGPTIKYLSDIGAAGVDLVYLLFGCRLPSKVLDTDRLNRVERQVFQLIEEYAEKSRDGRLSAESRYALFEVLRNHLTSDRPASNINVADVLVVRGA